MKLFYSPVLILDLEAHCVGGTASSIAGAHGIRELDIATNGFDAHETTEEAKLRVVTDARAYLATIEDELALLSENGSGLCVASPTRVSTSSRDATSAGSPE